MSSVIIESVPDHQHIFDVRLDTLEPLNGEDCPITIRMMTDEIHHEHTKLVWVPAGPFVRCWKLCSEYDEVLRPFENIGKDLKDTFRNLFTGLALEREIALEMGEPDVYAKLPLQVGAAMYRPANPDKNLVRKGIGFSNGTHRTRILLECLKPDSLVPLQMSTYGLDAFAEKIDFLSRGTNVYNDELIAEGFGGSYITSTSPTKSGKYQETDRTVSRSDCYRDIYPPILSAKLFSGKLTSSDYLKLLSQHDNQY